MWQAALHTSEELDEPEKSVRAGKQDTGQGAELYIPSRDHAAVVCLRSRFITGL